MLVITKICSLPETFKAGVKASTSPGEIGGVQFTVVLVYSLAKALSVNVENDKRTRSLISPRIVLVTGVTCELVVRF